jgi:DegV family protein with EDD domain
MIKIVTDSTSDLGEQLTSKYNIQVIPLLVNINNYTYKDGVDITPSEIFSLVSKTGELPKTAAPSVIDYTNVFDCSDDVFFMGISSKLSASMANAKIAADNLKNRNIRIIDSLNLSTGIGLLILRAADMRDEGKSIDEIETAIKQLIPKVRTSFVIDTLTYLHMGGRCTAVQALVGSLLKLRPVIEVRTDGTLGVKDKVGGSRKKALTTMLESYKKDLPLIDLRRVFVTHSGCDDDAQFLAQEIEKISNPQEVLITTAGAVVSSHCGPDTIGILYLMK